MSERRGPLRDVLVVERAGRLAVAACAHLLAALGARVVRVEDAPHAPSGNGAIDRLERGGKEIVAVAADELLGAADVVLLEPIAAEDLGGSKWRAILDDEARGAIVAVISAAGLK